MDSELIQRFQEGDLSAFDQLVSRHYYKAKQTAYLITQNKELAEEIVQDAFLICYQKLHLLRNPACFQTWFYKILVRMSKKALQKEKWLTFLSFRDDLEINGFNYEEMANNQYELYLALYEAINQLRPALRTVVILYYFNDMPLSEIATVLACREGTVKSRLFHARKKLEIVLRQSDALSRSIDYFKRRKNECQTNY
jgi:RNA polymerase sigma factor (sigma-70 family)